MEKSSEQLSPIMKKTNIIILLLFIFTVVSSQSLMLDGKQFNVDTISNFQIGPGSQYTQLRLQSDVRLDVYFIKVNAQNQYVSFKSELGRDSIYGRERTSAIALRKSKAGDIYFAGTNADFFDLSAEYMGYPLGGSVVGNEIARIPETTRPVVAFQDNKTPFLGRMSFSGKVTAGENTRMINRINHLRSTDQLILYNQHNGAYTRTNQYGTEVLVEPEPNYSWGVSQLIKAKVIQIYTNKGNTKIPDGLAVLSGHGTAATFLNNLNVNDVIDINLDIMLDGNRINVSQMVGGDNRNPMLNNGVLEFNQVWDELHPRTAFGYSKDKQSLIFCVVDGRSVSVGVTTKELAQLMKSAGAYTAFNLDGGGSSGMYIKDFGIVNRASDGSERSVGNSLFVSSSAPSSCTITAIKANVTSVKLQPNATFKPVFMGYNQYGTLINKDLQGVQLTSSSATGQILSDGSFQASGTQDGYITAKHNNLDTKIFIDIVFPADNQSVESISEDFSSSEWDAEFKRLNEDFTTLSSGQTFNNMNNVDLYMGKYAFEGAIIGEPATPNCQIEDITHNFNNAAVGFRFRNSGESYMTFPEMKNAGAIQIHVRNANNTAATTLTLQKFQSGAWTNIHTFNLSPKNSYSSKSVDEVHTYNINSETPVKLRLSRGDRFITLFRVDIHPYGFTDINKISDFRFVQQGRTILFDVPTEMALYNPMGILLFKNRESSRVEIPQFIGNGIFIVKTPFGTQKIILRD